jgi:hypothetical protein
MKIELRGLDEAVKIAKEVQGQAPYILARTLSKTAVAVKGAEVDEMRKVFDRPTPYTLGGVYVKTASKSNLTARVWLKDKLQAGKGTAAADFLWPQVHGGERQLKRFEKALQYAGVLPRGYYAVPGSGAKMDRYGNMDKGQIVQLISYFQGFGEQGYRANMTGQKIKKLAKGKKTTRGFAYFAIPPGKHIYPGIYQRTGFAWGTAIKPVLIFVRSTRYKKRFDFHGVGQTTADKVWENEFYQAFDDAISTKK